MTQQEWCIEQHRNTNHYYDKYLPYEFHLRMVVQAYKDWKHLLKKKVIVEVIDQRDIDITDITVEKACWGHDLIEDCRCSYNDVYRILGKPAADIVYACTNEKGKNREERGNEKYYEGIRKFELAVFVKLCDRIANTQYSKMVQSSQYKMYKEENEKFLERMGYNTSHQYKEMFDYLINLFE